MEFANLSYAGYGGFVTQYCFKMILFGITKMSTDQSKAFPDPQVLIQGLYGCVQHLLSCFLHPLGIGNKSVDIEVGVELENANFWK
jgi:hypothetical protein